jgi:hypothetical protein
MPTYTWPIPANLQAKISDDMVGAVNQYLTAQGFTAAGIADLEVTLTSDPPTLVIVADTDPTTTLTAYTGTPSAERDRIEKARDVALSYRDKVIAQQAVTAAETTKALAAAITLIERLARTD